MSLPHRISVGAILIKDQKVLLVRYPSRHGGSYLVAPGGGVESEEELGQTAIRELREETGIIAAVVKPLAVEDLVCELNRACKFWFLCNYLSGNVQETEEARIEGITQAGWFTRDQLERETVFPWLLKKYEWGAFASPDWQTQWADLRRMRL